MSPQLVAQVLYLAASVLFVLSLRGLTHPESARRGILFGEIGMLAAVVGTLLHQDIITYEWILLGAVIGSLIGAPMAIFMPMTAMPQRIALSHAFGALAAVLVGVDKYIRSMEIDPVTGTNHMTPALMTAVGFEVLFGALTITGSLMAFGKLQELIRGAPITYPLQNVTNITFFVAAFGVFLYLIFDPSQTALFYGMLAAGLVIGVLMVLPIGGADMPVVVSLLNSYAGLAASATGFALGNNVLIIAGALDGASGFLLSIIMSKAMNRSFTNVLFGAFGAPPEAAAAGAATDKTVRATTAEDLAVQLAYAKLVVVVPGYGMAVSQAQAAVREVAEQVEKRGGEVIYAIHPVAGRMPGHMNVLLAEANVPYEKLLEMEQVNDKFPDCDVALVVGANDVVNPAARNDKSSPIYGMPILDVDRAKSVIVLKRGMSVGFAGIDNELFYRPNTWMLFGDAKKSLTSLANELKTV